MDEGVWASDGSDYDISLNSCSEEDSEDDIGSINSTNYHNEIDGVFPPERILQHWKVRVCIVLSCEFKCLI